jgi:hypothetical protein
LRYEIIVPEPIDPSIQLNMTVQEVQALYLSLVPETAAEVARELGFGTPTEAIQFVADLEIRLGAIAAEAGSVLAARSIVQ